MKKISFETKVKVKLNDNGKNIYYLYNKINEIDDFKPINNDEILEISIKDFLKIFSIGGYNLYSLLEIESILVEEQELFINTPIKIKLTSFGRQIYYLYIYDIIFSNKNLDGLKIDQEMENYLDNGDFLTLSLEEINMIFGKYIEKNPIVLDSFEVLEKNLRYPLDYNKHYADKIKQVTDDKGLPIQVFLNEEAKKLLVDYVSEVKVRSCNYDKNNDIIRCSSILNRLQKNGTFLTSITELYEIFGVYLIKEDKKYLFENNILNLNTNKKR